ncbi:MAG: hypothetical protein RR853_09065 [Aurantimicrobium sp.]|uniref:hypothetical protein n=1 Tax=Aurantimicrobium sp. TaxID=1930784 RepID=UPI002FCADA0C
MSDWQEKHAAQSAGLKFLRHEYDAQVYEVKRVDLKNGSFVTERRVTTTHSSERVVWESKWKETARFACHCCTCDEDYYTGQQYNDPYCRNHGYYGERPCDIHNLPGMLGEEDTEMPDSVLTVRKQQATELEKLKAERGERA